MNSDENRKIAKWKISNFADRFAEAEKKDSISSPLFKFYDDSYGPIIFTLKFRPRRPDKSKTSSVHFEIVNAKMGVHGQVNGDTWMEKTDGTREDSRRCHFHFCDIETEHDLISEISQEEMKDFKDEKTVFLCFQLDFEVQKFGIIQTPKVPHRWEIQRFDELCITYEEDIEETMWGSGNFKLPNLKDAEFELELKACGGATISSTELGNHSAVELQFELWIEEKNGKRSFKNAETLLFEKDNIEKHIFCDHSFFDQFADCDTIFVCFEVQAALPDPNEMHPIRCFNQIAGMFNVDAFADVEIRVEDVSFQVSKPILCSQSKVFFAMFTNPTKEKQFGVIEIEDANVNLVEKMLRFMYTGGVEELDLCAAELIFLADRYEIEYLIKLCILSLIKEIHMENIVDRLKLAFQLVHLKDLTVHVFHFAKQNANQIAKLPQIRELDADFLRELVQIIAIP